MDVNEQVDRLNAAREKAQQLEADKSRLEGELSGLNKRILEITEKCKNDFGCDVSELESLIQKMNKEAEEALLSAEKILAGKSEVVVTSTQKPAEDVRVPIRRPISQTVQAEDEDCLLG